LVDRVDRLSVQELSTASDAEASLSELADRVGALEAQVGTDCAGRQYEGKLRELVLQIDPKTKQGKLILDRFHKDNPLA